MMILAFIFLVVVGIVYFRNRKIQKTVEKLLCIEGSHRNGHVLDKKGSSYPVLTFLHRGDQVQVEVFPRVLHHRPHVKVSIKLLTYRNCQIKIYCNTWFGVPSRSPLKRVKMGHKDFDRKIVIKTDEETIPPTVITPSVQEMLLRCNTFPININLKKESFVTMIKTIPTGEMDYTRLIDLALITYDRLREFD